MPRQTLIRLVLLMLALTAVLSAILVPIEWNGTQASEEAGPIDTLLDVMIVLSNFVFSAVIVMLGYSVWKYKAKPGDESDGEPIHGNTRVEVIWTVVPTVIVMFGAVYSWVVLNDIEAKEPDRMVLNVTAEQFAWSFEYPEEKVRSTELVVPEGRQIEVRLRAKDVIHSFWVPEWRIKKDAVPGMTTKMWVTPDERGNFALICAELCGLGHSTMRASVTVVSDTEFDKWLADQGGDAGGKEEKPDGEGKPEEDEGAAAEGEKVFTATGCAGCHVIEEGEAATVGPNLAESLAGEDAEFIRTSILDPDATVAEGYSKGVMPPDYEQRLSREELSALVEFLRSKAAK